MNRQKRRALERAAKKTHKLPSETCVLWVPAERGYVVRFSADRVDLVDRAEYAQHYCDDHASTAALAFFEVTGLRAEVRPCLAGRHHRRLERGSIASAVGMIAELRP